jgi:SAM-dependent methyltransferase
MNYELAYRIGFHPWEDAEEQPAFIESFSALLDREEQGRTAPYGAALDLGTGNGTWGIKLAERGWQVTGLDIVERVLERARARIREAGVEMRALHGDVTALRPEELGADYRLLLDTGTFHGLGDAERLAMGRGVDAIAAADATVLLIAWDPKRRGPLPRGVSREEVAAAFPGWEVFDAGPSGFEAPKPVELLLRPGERWYRLRRR